METNQSVGAKIKSLRESKSISIEEIASRSGLSKEQISAIEENNNLPALASLLKIARALGVRLGTFLDDQEEVGAAVCRATNRNREATFHTNQGDSKHHMDYFSLSESKTNRHMEPFVIDIAPDSEVKELSSHEGEEFIFVLSGEIEAVYGKKNYILNQGDSIYYDSIVPHLIHTFGTEQAQILAVVYTPI